MMRKLRMIGAVGVLILAGTAAAALASPAQAADDCKGATVTHSVHVTGWPDRGKKLNVWAEKNMTRTFAVCATATPETGDWTYKAIATDAGTFVTKAGDSPAGTVTLRAGVKGKVSGGFTATFTGPSPLVFTPNAVTSGGYLENSDWIPAVFPGAKLTDFTGWSWKYTTCSETHRQAEPNVFEGDITGKACPTKTPTAKPTTPAAPPAPANPGAAGSLPVTGTSLPLIVGGGVALLVVGAGAMWLTRRRVRIEA